MIQDFKDITYLKTGNSRQQKTYRLLQEHRIIEVLLEFNPLVVGTIPIGIDIDSSDVDIILHTQDFEGLLSIVEREFSEHSGFNCFEIPEKDVLIVHFSIENLPFELYVGKKPSHTQNGYLHMLKEAAILEAKGEDFRKAVIHLKQEGVKTEPAFCKLLGLKGDPYIALLEYPI